MVRNSLDDLLETVHDKSTNCMPTCEVGNLMTYKFIHGHDKEFQALIPVYVRAAYLERVQPIYEAKYN